MERMHDRNYFFAIPLNSGQAATKRQGVVIEMPDTSYESRPLDALNNARNKRVIVELKNNKQFVGKLKAFDIHVNVVLDEAEERADGEVKRKLGTIFLRGDMIVMISTE